MALSLIMKAILLCGTAVVVTSYELLGEHVLKEKATVAFQILDRNRNGWISVDEYLANFDRMDTNGDGMLTVREYSQLPAGEIIPYPVKKVFNYYDKLDGNSDGNYQRTEVEPLFRRIELNGDGRVTEDEIITFFLTELRIPLQG